MNARLIKQFKKRWKTVELFEQAETKHMSNKERLLKTINLMQLGFGLGYSVDRSTLNEIQKVRSRWIKLKSHK